MKHKTILILTLLFLLIGCEVSGEQNHSSTYSSSTNYSQNEVTEFILKGINEADALDITYKVKNQVDNQLLEITFYYVCNNSDNINDFEMLMLTFMKVNNDNEINIAKSFYKNKEFYLSLLNIASGEHDLYKIIIDDTMSLDDLIDVTGMHFFYSPPSDDLFSNIDQEVLEIANFKVEHDYIYDYQGIVNKANITMIKVNKELTTIEITTSELDVLDNPLDQIITLIPKFNNKFDIKFTDNKNDYQLITFEELEEIINQE